MEIKQITDKKLWDDFILGQKPDTFLQSWNWGEFNKNTGEKIWRIGLFENDIVRLSALVIKVKAKRGSFLFIPHGPVIDESGNKNQESGKILWDTFFSYLKKLGRQEKVDFLRISPLLENGEQNLKIFKDAGFKNAPIHMMHPELTWLLDISKNENDILKGMRKTHRNLIRRAEKDGVKITKDYEEKSLRAFYDIHMETVKRHKFIPFSYDYIKEEINTFKKDDQILIFSAHYNEKIISSAIIIFYGKEAFYHHGASSSEYSKVPSSYLVLWEAIREAKKRNCEIFNFYGIVRNKPNHPWNGLSKFKEGFGGYEKELLHCQDFILSSKYLMNFMVETLRKIKRGY